jgi:hypothetical protein
MPSLSYTVYALAHLKHQSGQPDLHHCRRERTERTASLLPWRYHRVCIAEEPVVRQAFPSFIQIMPRETKNRTYGMYCILYSSSIVVRTSSGSCPETLIA